VVYDNDLEYEWSRDQENDSNTGDVRIFRQLQASRKIIVIRPVFLYCSWQLMLWLLFFDLLFRGASTPPFISKRGEVTRKVTESVTT
jgi:hypothetical protein